VIALRHPPAAGGTPPSARALAGFSPEPTRIAMTALKPLALIALLALGLAGCNDKKAESTTPTKPDATKLEPQTDQAPPADQKPKP
jgi:hypothetical protein